MQKHIRSKWRSKILCKRVTNLFRYLCCVRAVSTKKLTVQGGASDYCLVPTYYILTLVSSILTWRSQLTHLLFHNWIAYSAFQMLLFDNWIVHSAWNNKEETWFAVYQQDTFWLDSFSQGLYSIMLPELQSTLQFWKWPEMPQSYVMEPAGKPFLLLY